MRKSLIFLFVALLVFAGEQTWAIGGYLGQKVVGDSLDVPYFGINCEGNRATADTIRYYITKDTTGANTVKVDSGKVVSGTLPTRILRSEYTPLTQYALRVKASDSNGDAGRYTIEIVARTDTCWTPFTYWWTAVDTTDQTYHSLNYFNTKNLPSDPADDSDIDGQLSTIDGNVDGIKTKTDQLGFTTKGLEVAVKELDEDSATVDLDGSTIGTVTNITNIVKAYLQNDSLYALMNDVDGIKTVIDALLDDSLGNAKNKIILAYNIVEALLDDSLGNAKNRILTYLDEAISGLLSRGDSSLYMRTDWNNIKNQDGQVNLSHTRMAYVDTVDSITQTFSASCDTESIARSTWNDGIIPKAERRIQYVDSLGEEISASMDTSQIKAMNDNNLWGAYHIWNYSTRTLTSGAGAGANQVVIRCKQSSDSSSVAFAQIQVLDSTETSTIGLLTSDSQGRGFLALDNGVYCVRLYKPGWQFTVPETLMVNGDEDTTYYAEAFDPGSPAQASLCRVYGWIYDINHQPMVGTKVEASIKTVPLRYQNVVISPYYKSAVTDDNGFWYLDLYPNSVLSPSDTKYIFHIFSPSGTILRLQTEIPDQATWELQW